MHVHVYKTMKSLLCCFACPSVTKEIGFSHSWENSSCFKKRHTIVCN